MVSQIRRGVLDMIGAARPSIADPFLPRKIEEGCIEDIRECIGCNICVSGDNTIVPMRCTQNPTVSEEWRKGWHPEIFPQHRSDDKVLVVGGGPAGLEAARALGARGYQVTVAEAGRSLGGRVANEAGLAGLSAWNRVSDYRTGQIGKMPNVDVYFDSELNADTVLEFGFSHVVVATGSHWRRDGVGRTHRAAISGLDKLSLLTPDDWFADRSVTDTAADGPVVIFDDDGFYMAGALAETIRLTDRQVTLVTPSSDVSPYTHYTLEQSRIQRRLIELGVNIRTHRMLAGAEQGAIRIACTYTQAKEELQCAAFMLVTARLPNDDLYTELVRRRAEWTGAGISTVRVIGDAEAPGTIAAAVYSGHRYARELNEPPVNDAVPFKRELPRLEDPVQMGI